jgi:hypothetical protein
LSGFAGERELSVSGAVILTVFVEGVVTVGDFGDGLVGDMDGIFAISFRIKVV